MQFSSEGIVENLATCSSSGGGSFENTKVSTGCIQWIKLIHCLTATNAYLSKIQNGRHFGRDKNFLKIGKTTPQRYPAGQKFRRNRSI